MPAEGMPNVSTREAPRGGVEDATLRVRSIWLTQLSLGIAIVAIAIVALGYEPEIFQSPLMIAGVVSLVAITGVSLLIPWNRLPRWAPVTIPFADIIAIGLLSASTILPLGFFWVFPVTWIGLHFSIWALGGAIGAIGASLLIEAATSPEPPGAVELFTVLLGLTFLGVTAHLTMRQTRAFKRLLLGQTRRLETTLDRVTHAERSTTELLNGVDVGILRFARDGTLLAGNTTYARLYGTDPDDPAAPPSSVEYTSLRGDPIPAAERTFERAQRGEIFTDQRVWLFDAAGTWRALSVSTTRLTSTADDSASTMLVAHDITAVTEAERERERIAAVASHELRHPLTVIIGHADLALEEEEGLTPRIIDHLQTILGASERMLEISSTLLQRSQQGFTTSQDRRSFDLVPMIGAVVEAFGAASREQGVTITTHLPDRMPLDGDVFRLRQVFDNLISNAVKYTPSGGSVKVDGAIAADTVSVVVADTGIGIGADDLDHIFDPLFRSTRAQEQAPGTGLGLGIAREIVESHGGELTVSSELGHGTRVTVRLPRTASPASESGTASP